MTDTPKTPVPALVLGLSPTGLLIARSLGRRGVPVFGADFDPWGIARASRFCRHVPEVSEASRQRDGAVLRDALAAFARRTGTRPVLYLTSDAYIELLSPHSADLERDFRLATALDETTRVLLDKRRFYASCVAHGVELPATWFRQDVDDIERVADQVAYPAIIKPAFPHHLAKHLGGAKVVEVFDRAALVRTYRDLARVDDDLVIQEVVPGGDDRIAIAACYMDAAHEPRALFVGRKLRQYRPRFGSASLAVAEWDQRVADACVDYLRAVGFRGLCGAEFKWDPRDGRLKMIEVNARATLWMGLTTAAGVDVPYVAYCDLLGLPLPPVVQRDGVKWTYLPRDVQSALHYLRAGEMSGADWVRSVRGCHHEAIAALDDPLPLAYVPLYGARRLLRWRRGGAAG